MNNQSWADALELRYNIDYEIAESFVDRINFKDLPESSTARIIQTLDEMESDWQRSRYMRKIAARRDISDLGLPLVFEA